MPTPRSTSRNLLLAVVIAFALPIVPAQEGVEDSSLWRSSYTEGLQLARARRALLIVYLADAGERPGPPLALTEKRSSLPAVGARIEFEESDSLRDWLGLKRAPAIAILDRRENLLQSWDGSIPRDFRARFHALYTNVRRHEERDARVIEEATTLERDGKTSTAYAKIAPLLASPFTSPENLYAAEEIEDALIRRGRARVLSVLSAEGLVAEATLIESLSRLFPDPMPPRLISFRDREILRLQVSTIGLQR